MKIKTNIDNFTDLGGTTARPAWIALTEFGSDSEASYVPR